MIAVDTSVWVDALRQRDSPVGDELHRLLDRGLVALPIPVRIEILAGAPTAEHGRLRRLLSALPSWRPDEATWRRIDGWLEVAVAAGERFGFADLLIAALASERDAGLWTLDRDFDRMERLGWLRLHSAPAGRGSRAPN